MIKLEQMYDPTTGKKYYLLTISSDAFEYKKLLAEVTEKVNLNELVPCENPDLYIEKK